MAVTEFRKNIADVMNRVSYGHERVALEKNGKPTCAIISFEDLQLLEASEDKYDIAEAKKAIKRNDFVDWNTVKQENVL